MFYDACVDATGVGMMEDIYMSCTCSRTWVVQVNRNVDIDMKDGRYFNFNTVH